ncbi:MAG: hypothetical protein ACM3O3_10830 [Syntrophothermus sp.]
MSDDKKPGNLNEGYIPIKGKDGYVPLKKGYTPTTSSLGKTPPPNAGSGVKNPPTNKERI